MFQPADGAKPPQNRAGVSDCSWFRSVWWRRICQSETCCSPEAELNPLGHTLIGETSFLSSVKNHHFITVVFKMFCCSSVWRILIGSIEFILPGVFSFLGQWGLVGTTGFSRVPLAEANAQWNETPARVRFGAAEAHERQVRPRTGIRTTVFSTQREALFSAKVTDYSQRWGRSRYLTFAADVLLLDLQKPLCASLVDG